MSKGKNIKFIYQSIDPATDDEFDGGGHDRTAEALAEAVEEFDSTNASIGLEGDWGSGKTTVVNITEKKLSEGVKGKYYFFTYDHWANQTVDFRRSFLEQFADWIKIKNLASPKKDKEFKDTIRDRTKEIDTYSYRVYSLFGAALILSLPFLPFLVLWLSPFAANFHIKQAANNDAVIDKNTTTESIPVIYDFLINYGHWIAFGVLSTLAFIYLITLVYFIWKNGLCEGFNRSLSLFSKKFDKDIINQKIRETDPTQYEFQSTFEKMLSTIQVHGRRIVIIFDNIDRVSNKYISSLWSEVRAVTARPDGSPNTAITSIIPYDRKRVLEAINDQKSPSEDEGQKNTYLDEDIFRKSFKAILRVSPPVMSNLETFLTKKFKNALGDQLSGEELFNLFKIFDAFLDEQNIPATPRQAISFVNDIGKLYAQWDGEIEPSIIAVYVLYQVQIDADPKCIKATEFIVQRVLNFALIHKDFYKQLAALAYNIEPDLAYEILIERDVLRALRSDDSKSILDVAKFSGFEVQIDDILNRHVDDFASGELKTFANVVSNFNAIEISSQVKSIGGEYLLKAFPKVKAIALGEDGVIDENVIFDKFIQIAEFTNPNNVDEATTAFSIWIKKTIQKNEDNSEIYGRNWVLAIGKYISKIRECHGKETADNLLSKFFLNYNTAFRLGVAIYVDEVGLSYDQLKRTKGNKDEIAISLIKLAQENRLFKYAWQEIHVDLSETNRQQVYEAIRNDINTTKKDDAKQRVNIIEALRMVFETIKDEKFINSATIKLFNQGGVYSYLNEYNDDETDELYAQVLYMAGCIYHVDETLPTLIATSHKLFGDLSEARTAFASRYSDEIEQTIAKKVAKYVVDNNQAEDWYQKALDGGDQSFHSKVAMEVIGVDNATLPSLGMVISSFEKIETVFEDKSEALLIAVGETVTDEDIANITINNFSDITLRQIQNRSERGWKKLVEKIDEYLISRDQTMWNSALVKQTTSIRMLRVRGDELSGKLKAPNLKEALKQYFLSIASEADTAPSNDLDDSVLFNSLPTSTSNALYNDLVLNTRKSVTSSNGINRILNKFPVFFDQAKFSKHSDVSVEFILIRVFDLGLETSISVLRANSIEWKKTIKNCTTENRELVYSYLESWLESEGEDEREKAEELYKLLGLKKRPVPKKEETSEADKDETPAKDG